VVGEMDKGVDRIEESAVSGMVTPVGRLKNEEKQAMSEASGDKLPRK
jgi:hypothetical protein